MVLIFIFCQRLPFASHLLKWFPCAVWERITVRFLLPFLACVGDYGLITFRSVKENDSDGRKGFRFRLLWSIAISPKKMSLLSSVLQGDNRCERSVQPLNWCENSWKPRINIKLFVCDLFCQLFRRFEKECLGLEVSFSFIHNIYNPISTTEFIIKRKNFNLVTLIIKCASNSSNFMKLLP